MAQDPVCGMEVDEAQAKWRTEYQGKSYFFCGRMCKEDFDQDPQKYIWSVPM